MEIFAFHRGSWLFAQAQAPCPTGNPNKFISYCNTGLPKASASSGNLHSLLQIVFAVAGGIAVIMIVLGGLRFITAQGDANGVAQARKTLLFALVGLMIALFAEVVVTFVIGKL
jgi:hypothetical protein